MHSGFIALGARHTGPQTQSQHADWEPCPQSCVNSCSGCFLSLLCSFLSYSLAGLYLPCRMIACALLCFSPLTPQKSALSPGTCTATAPSALRLFWQCPVVSPFPLPDSVSALHTIPVSCSHSVVSFTLSAAPQRCCGSGKHYFYMQQIPSVVCCPSLLTANNKTGNLQSLQVLHSWWKSYSKIAFEEAQFQDGSI